MKNYFLSKLKDLEEEYGGDWYELCSTLNGDSYHDKEILEHMRSLNRAAWLLTAYEMGYHNRDMEDSRRDI